MKFEFTKLLFPKLKDMEVSHETDQPSTADNTTESTNIKTAPSGAPGSSTGECAVETYMGKSGVDYESTVTPTNNAQVYAWRLHISCKLFKKPI